MGRLTISGVNGGGCVFVNEQDKEFINKQGLGLTARMLSAYLARGFEAAEDGDWPHQTHLIHLASPNARPPLAQQGSKQMLCHHGQTC